MKRWRRVEKHEYDTLVRFHPGEVRYYVDISSLRRQKAGKRNTAARGGGGTNRPIILGLRQIHFVAGTKSAYVWTAICEIYKADPTLVLGRTELCNRIGEILPAYGTAGNVISPIVSECLRRGGLRYIGSTSDSDLTKQQAINFMK